MISLDIVDLQSVFRRRACVMRNCPQFPVESYRSAMRLAMTEAELGSASGDEQRRTRAWKLFLLLPRMFLFRPPRGGLLPKSQLLERVSQFHRGSWINLLVASQECSERALQVQRRRRRTQQDSVERRAQRAEALVQVGELSAGRQA